MLAMSFFQTTLSVLFMILCPLLVLIILLQKGRGGGLGAAFGGAGSSAFGTRTGDVFTWITIVLVGLFLLLAVSNALVIRPPTDMVTAVQFNPVPPGNIGETNQVKLYTATHGAAIYYTLDGTDPDKEGGIPYEDGANVPVQVGKVLKAIAVRTNWDDSRISEGVYGVEDELPELPGEGELDLITPVDDVEAPVDAPVEDIPVEAPTETDGADVPETE